jgi:hypothetical protein
MYELNHQYAEAIDDFTRYLSLSTDPAGLAQAQEHIGECRRRRS